jgi:hypothetical protein
MDSPIPGLSVDVWFTNGSGGPRGRPGGPICAWRLRLDAKGTHSRNTDGHGVRPYTTGVGIHTVGLDPRVQPL